LSDVDKRISSKNSHKVTGESKKKTVTRTFRISAEWDDLLKKEAEKEGISVNVLMNLILRRYTHVGRLAQGNNLICLTKTTFRKILEGIPLEQLILAGKNTSLKDFPHILGMLGITSDYDSFVYLVSRHFGGPNCAMWFCCYHHTQKNSDTFHLQHDLGRKWSLYLQEYFLSYLKTLKIEPETKVYDNALNIKVHRPR